MTRSRARSAISVALAAVVQVGCAGPLAAQQAPETWELSEDPVLEAGGPGAPAEELFTSIEGAVRLDDGRYAIADRGEMRVSIFGPDGELVGTIGSDGEGPGEFRYISGIWSTGGDTIGVWDSRLNRLTWLRPDGEVVRTIRPTRSAPDIGAPLDQFLGAFDDGRIGLAWLVPSYHPAQGEQGGKLHTDRMVFGLFDASGRFLRLLGQASGMVRSFGPSGGGPIAFSPYPWAVTLRDTLVYTNGLRGELLFYDVAAADSGVARRLAVRGRELELAEARRAVEAALDEASRRVQSMASSIATDVTAGQVPEHGGLLADDQGRLWLKAYDASSDPLLLGAGRRTGGTWKVVETDGTVVARLDMPDDVAPLAVEDGLLLGLARDALDVERFVVHRILR